MIFWLIGNLISAVAAVFTAKSSWAEDRWHIYFYQVVQCLLLAAASVFFRSYAGVVSLLACALRNYLAAKDRLTKPWLIICLLLVLIPGIALNNRGLTGWVVIVANGVYTLGMFFARSELAMKGNIILNLLLWIVYEVRIGDIPSMIADGIGLFAAAGSLLRRENRRNLKKDENWC